MLPEQAQPEAFKYISVVLLFREFYAPPALMAEKRKEAQWRNHYLE
jgi:hypothetical protein